MPQSELAVSSTAPQPVFSSRILRTTAAVICGSALVALCSHLSVPLVFTPVPLTLQNFAVLLVGLLLEPPAAFAALALYLLEGAAGLPVFSPFSAGGLAHLFGPNGGYLLSYPLAAAFTSLLTRRIRPVSLTSAIFAAAAGSLIVYVMGASWFSILSGLPWSAVLKMTVWPFLPGDALKVIAVGAIATGLFKLRNRNRQSGLANGTAL